MFSPSFSPGAVALVLLWPPFSSLVSLNYSYHKYGEFRDFLLEVNGDKKPEDWSITCILFAPNAPQQNPVEDIWLQAKNFLRKYWYLCRSFKIVNFLERIFY